MENEMLRNIVLAFGASLVTVIVLIVVRAVKGKKESAR